MAVGARKLADVYANRAFGTLTLSGANILTFLQLQFGVGLFQGVAMILNRIEWHFHSATWRELVDVADSVTVALTNRDDLASLDPSNQSVLAACEILPMMIGAVVSLTNVVNPVISDFSSIPGGGLILPANPIFLAMRTTGMAAAGIVRAILYFTWKTLTDAEYIELIQTIMPANI